MPYSGPDDDKLPERIRKMPAKKRRAFVHAFNSAYRDGDEGRAFAIANAAANRAGEKAMEDEVAIYTPYGGATTFAEFDAWHAVQREQYAIESTFYQFQALMENLGRVPDLGQNERYTRAQALVEELSSRLEEVKANPEIAFKEAVTLGAALAAPGKKDGPTGFLGYLAEGSLSGKEIATTTPDGTFIDYKDAAGVPRWVTIHTNKFRDSDREIFTEKSHLDYIERVEASGNYPELQLWHTPLPIGRADMLAYDDRGFVVASGTYAEGYEDVGARLAEMAKEQPLGCSHGFQYDRLDRLDGVFEWYDTREITVLPLQRAANRLTVSGPLGSKETEMLTEEKATFLRGALGDERFAADIEGRLAELAQKAADDGLDFKEAAAIAEAPPAEAPAAEAPATPEPAAVTTNAADPAVVITTGTSTTVPATPDVAASVVEALAAQGALDPPAEAPPVETPAAEAPVDPPADPAPAAEAKDETPVEPVAPAVDPTIPEHPMETPTTPAPAAPLDPASNEAQFVSLLRKALGEAIQPIELRMSALERDYTGLKEAQQHGMDRAIAEAISPRVGPPATPPASAVGDAPTAAEVAAIEAVKAEADKPDGASAPEHLAPYLAGMLRPVIES